MSRNLAISLPSPSCAKHSTHGIGMKAIAQNPIIEFPQAMPRSLNIGSTAIGIPAPNNALTKSFDANAEAAYFGYAVGQFPLTILERLTYHPVNKSRTGKNCYQPL